MPFQSSALSAVMRSTRCPRSRAAGSEISWYRTLEILDRAITTSAEKIERFDSDKWANFMLDGCAAAGKPTFDFVEELGVRDSKRPRPKVWVTGESGPSKTTVAPPIRIQSELQFGKRFRRAQGSLKMHEPNLFDWIRTYQPSDIRS